MKKPTLFTEWSCSSHYETGFKYFLLAGLAEQGLLSHLSLGHAKQNIFVSKLYFNIKKNFFFCVRTVLDLRS